MPKILILDTATEVCSVALVEDGAVILEHSSNEDFSHTSVLTLLIAQLLKEAKCPYSELSAIALSAGPGSYTGLRVGSATAKGLCYGLSIPLISLDTLHGYSYGVTIVDKTKTNFIISMIDARRNEVYAAIYDPNHHVLEPVHSEILTEQSFSRFRLPGAQWYLTGNGATKAIDLLGYKSATIAQTASSSRYYAILATEAFKRSNFEDAAYFMPYYQKAPNITPSKKNLF